MRLIRTIFIIALLLGATGSFLCLIAGIFSFDLPREILPISFSSFGVSVFTFHLIVTSDKNNFIIWSRSIVCTIYGAISVGCCLVFIAAMWTEEIPRENIPWLFSGMFVFGFLSHFVYKGGEYDN